MKDMIWRLCLVCIVAILCTARSVDACACADLGSLADEYHKSSAVFVGLIVAIEISTRVYKGDKIEKMVRNFRGGATLEGTVTSASTSPNVWVPHVCVHVRCRLPTRAALCRLCRRQAARDEFL